MGIRIRHLRLRGLSKNYDVSFVLNGTTRPLSVISGEISTGKTSILEFIDYCLGARTHPQAPEIQRTARAAFLEIDANGEICVIERPLFSSERAVWIHRCTINDIGDHHAKHRKIIEPISDSESLSMFLLDQCGLGGLTLKESPTQQSSGIDTLSFRDVMWLGYLTNRRIDNRYLLNEQN